MRMTGNDFGQADLDQEILVMTPNGSYLKVIEFIPVGSDGHLEPVLEVE